MKIENKYLMQFHEIINAKYSLESDRPLMQKDSFPVNANFDSYLKKYDRNVLLPLQYNDLLNYSFANSVKDNKGKWTHWENAIYEPDQLSDLHDHLIETFLMLKNNNQKEALKNYRIESIDFCEYGNSVPFRIKIIENITGKTDLFYVKLADASRIYGLELEHLLTENPINFLYHQNTLVEEHIEGIPGDVFLEENIQLCSIDKTAVAKAFIQFNESCFVRLLGDMRSYNFVVNIVPLDNKNDFTIRAIDFDQQCYEGKKNLYYPQFYKENVAFVEMVLQYCSTAEIKTQQQIANALIISKIIKCRKQLMALLNSMVLDEISENYKIILLRTALNEHFKTNKFTACKTMGAIVKQQLKQLLQQEKLNLISH